MKRVRLVLIGMFVSLWVGACDDAVDKRLDEASAVTDKLCRCPDVACGETVTAELEALKARGAEEQEPPTGKQVARAAKLAIRWDNCLEAVSRRSR